MLASIRQRIMPTPCKAFRPKRYIGKHAIEIGNFSNAFLDRGAFPVYRYLASLDRVLKATTTPWTAIDASYGLSLQKTQYVSCGVECRGVPRGHYDVILSCHVLEHIANPLKALLTWRDLLKPTGELVLLLPRRSHTFDRMREQTTFRHLLADYDTAVSEDDRTHIEDFVRNYDEGMASDLDLRDLLELTLRQREIGNVHHHTWDLILAVLAVQWAGFAVSGFCHQRAAAPGQMPSKTLYMEIFPAKRVLAQKHGNS